MDELKVEKTIKKSHLGIYAIIEKEESILLVKKARGPYLGMWDLPGGRPIHGEIVSQTLQREVLEETGLLILDTVFHGNQAFLLEYKENEETISLHHICLIYKVLKFDSSQFQDDINEEDVAGCSWIKKSQLSQLNLSKVALCVV
ncbi:MAG: NUDIX domain-containing protein [Chlamydiota bacterium]